MKNALARTAILIAMSLALVTPAAAQRMVPGNLRPQDPYGLAAGESQPSIGCGHVGECALGQTEPAPRCDLDLAGGHPAEAVLNRLHGHGGGDEGCDLVLGEVERHGRPSLGRPCVPP